MRLRGVRSAIVPQASNPPLSPEIAQHSHAGTAIQGTATQGTSVQYSMRPCERRSDLPPIGISDEAYGKARTIINVPEDQMHREGKTECTREVWGPVVLFSIHRKEHHNERLVYFSNSRLTINILVLSILWGFEMICAAPGLGCLDQSTSLPPCHRLYPSRRRISLGPIALYCVHPDVLHPYTLP